MINSRQLSNALTERFGLGVNAKISQVADGQKIIIRPNGIEKTISFQIEIKLGWRTISALFKPGNYASSLIASMNAAHSEQKAAFSIFANSLMSKGASIELLLDGESVLVHQPDTWSHSWSTFQLSMKKVGVLLEKNSSYDFIETFPWATGFLGLSLSLLPLEEIPTENRLGENEGAVYYSISKRYERSRINRAACIEIHGTSCKICSHNFEDKFGAHGKGFIHIHHIVPVSEMGSSYALEPALDLIPVCPNCHAMLHRVNPALKPEDLKEIILK